MTRRPVVLLFCRTYLPGFKAGGPVRTLANMVAALGDECDFRVVTLDRDANDEAPYPHVETDRWIRVGKAQVRYMRAADVSLASLHAIVRAVAPDTLYLNSIMDTIFPARLLLLRRLGRIAPPRTVLAVRGQLNRGALGLRARAKRLYLGALRLAGLLDGLVWQATGAPEADAIRAAIGSRFFDSGRSGVVIAPNIAHADASAVASWRPRARGTPLRVAMLGRISPMKNVDGAIAVIAGMTEDASLDILGPIEDAAYWDRCRGGLAALSPPRAIAALGPIEPARVPAALARYDAFLLPTRGENFGHAIAEALSAGLPLVISDRTPWRDLAAHGVGVDLSLDDIGAFSRALDALARLDDDSLRARHETCAAYAKMALTDARILDANRALFLGATPAAHDPNE